MHEHRFRELFGDEIAEAIAKEEARMESGARGIGSLYDRTKSQLQSGLISYQGAQDKL